MRISVLVLILLFCPVIEPADAALVEVISHHGSTDPVTEGWDRDFTGSVSEGPYSDGPGGDPDAWEIDDSDLAGRGLYSSPLGPDLVDLAMAEGWVLSMQLRSLDVPDPPFGSLEEDGSPNVTFRNGTQNYSIHVGTDGSGDLIAMLMTKSLPAGSREGIPVAIPGSAGAFTTLQLIFDPGSQTADLFVNGGLAYSGYAGSPIVTAPTVAFGMGTTDGTGHAYIAQASFAFEIPSIVTATWNDVFAIQAHGAVLHPALLVGLSLGTAEVTSQTSDSITLTYSGLDPDSDVQINLASFVPPFYPPDEIHVVSPSRIEVDMDQDGTMFTLGIDFASSTGEVLDPASIIGFNPQPEPPAGSIYAFNPQPEPPALGDGLGIFIPLSGGVGAPGSTQITLTLEVLDDSLIALPLDLVGVATPALGGAGRGLAIGCLLGAAFLWARRRAGIRNGGR